MATALASDLVRIPGVGVRLAWDARLPRPGLPVEILSPRPGETSDRFLERGLRGCRAAWPIAPESGGILEHLSRAIRRAGRILLGSSPEAVRTAASKRLTGHALAGTGVPAVTTRTAAEEPPVSDTGWVLKPEWGEGGIGVRYCGNRAALGEAVAALPGPEGWVVQPFLPGEPASLSLRVTEGAVRILSRNRQRIAFGSGGVCLEEVVAGPPPEPEDPWQDRVRALVGAIPGLWGYVGVDFIQSPGGPKVLEINPRLTTAYPGLAAYSGANVAGAILRASGAQPVSPPVPAGEDHDER